VVLHRLAWRGTAAPDGTLLTAKGVLRGLASRLAISARAGDTPPGRPHGGALDFGSSRMGGRDATRRTEAMYPCTTGAAQGAWLSRSGTCLAPCWVATDGGPGGMPGESRRA